MNQNNVEIRRSFIMIATFDKYDIDLFFWSYQNLLPHLKLNN